VPKTRPDRESQLGRWVTLDEHRDMDNYPPGLRGHELLHWGAYLEAGGHIAPMTLINPGGR
jgi:hypothetical protein